MELGLSAAIAVRRADRAAAPCAAAHAKAIGAVLRRHVIGTCESVEMIRRECPDRTGVEAGFAGTGAAWAFTPVRYGQFHATAKTERAAIGMPEPIVRMD